MKRPLLLYCFTLLTLALSAQKVDLDRFYFTATYIELPRQGLDPNYRTYSVQVDMGELGRMSLHREDLAQNVVIDGWRRLDGGAHINVDIHIEDVVVESSNIVQREEIIKDKYGKQIGSKMHFATQLTYSFGARLAVTDYKGVSYMNQPLITRQNKRTFNCTEFDSKMEAEAYFRYNMMPVTKDLMRRSAMGVLQDVSNNLTVNYGFTQRTVNDFMWILNTRKNSETEAHKNAFQIIKNAMFAMTADQPLDKIRQQVQPAIQYFESLKKKYSSSSKADRKMRYASYYCLAKLYYYLDDPDNAMQQATGLELNDFDSGESRQLEAWVSDLKQLFQQSGLRSRHFAITPSQYQGPDLTTASNQ